MNINTIDIWAPKYSTNSVLVASHKILNGNNRVIFTKAKHLEGGVYEMDGEKMRTYPSQPNGKGVVHVIPFDDFTCTKEPQQKA